MARNQKSGRKLLLVGGYWNNSGPSNVNRSLLEASQGELCCLHSKNRHLRFLELAVRLAAADVVIVSGTVSRKINILLRRSGKKIIYLMHASVAYENQINHVTGNEVTEQAEQECFEMAEKIVCVSRRFSLWVQKRYPQFADKITYVNNGIEISPREVTEKIPFSIALSGGNRRIKNNGSVCRAVEKLIAEGMDCRVFLFGAEDPHGDPEIMKLPFVKVMGQMDNPGYYEALDSVSLFAVNSTLETFGNVVGDALNCRCSLLVSDFVGAGSILQLTEQDSIHDPEDTEELTEKIRYLFEHPNGDRLLKGLDPNACSGRQAYLNLRKICEEV